jgi:hypothetical protein
LIDTKQVAPLLAVEGTSTDGCRTGAKRGPPTGSSGDSSGLPSLATRDASVAMPLIHPCAAEGCNTLTMGLLCLDCERAEIERGKRTLDAALKALPVRLAAASPQRSGILSSRPE